jgi:hypothetical protein
MRRHGRSRFSLRPRLRPRARGLAPTEPDPAKPDQREHCFLSRRPGSQAANLTCTLRGHCFVLLAGGTAPFDTRAPQGARRWAFSRPSHPTSASARSCFELLTSSLARPRARFEQGSVRPRIRPRARGRAWNSRAWTGQDRPFRRATAHLFPRAGTRGVASCFEKLRRPEAVSGSCEPFWLRSGTSWLGVCASLRW